MLLCTVPREVDSETRSLYHVVPREVVKKLGHATMYSAQRGSEETRSCYYVRRQERWTVKLGHVTM